MKTLLILLVALIFSTIPAVSQTTGSVELQSKWPAGEKYVPDMEIYLHGTVTGPLNWWGWSLTSADWSEGYAGLAFAPFSYLEVGAAYGIETSDPSGRFGSFAWVGDDQWYLLGFYEQGGSGYWHRAILNFYFTPNVGFGAMDERGLGSGPRLEVKVNKFVCWGSMLQKSGEPSAKLLGIRYTF